jgi:gas vesicle protein
MRAIAVLEPENGVLMSLSVQGSQPTVNLEESGVLTEGGSKRTMSQRDGFTGGFLLGTLVGGIVGGVLGALVVAQRESEEGEQEKSLLNSGLSKAKELKDRKRKLQSEESIEEARRSLEDKIAQLNSAIDDVRQQLGPVNGNGETTNREQAIDS